MDKKNFSKNFFSKGQFWLLIILLVVLATRLVIVFQHQEFNYEAYYTLRQVDHIKHTGLPTYSDDLSYGGKNHLFAPLYYYILALFSFVMPIWYAAKIIPNLFAAGIVIIVYYLALRLIKQQRIALLTAFMSGFIPVLFFDANVAGLTYLALLLVFVILYCFLRMNEKRFVDYALICMLLLVMITPLAFILVIGFLCYLMILKLEGFDVELKELELVLFFTFLVVWVNILIYKKALMNHGFLIIWQNVPLQAISNFFGQLTFLEVFYTISIIPLIFGVYAIAAGFSGQRKRELLLFMSFSFAVFILLWFKLLNLITGLMFLSITLVILSSFALKRFVDFFEKTRIVHYEKIFVIVFIIIFCVSSIIPSIYFATKSVAATPSSNDIIILEWASVYIPKNMTIVAPLEQGHLVTYYAERKDVMDTDFLLVPHIDQRMSDLDTMYKTGFETQAVELMNKYDAQYFFVSDFALQKYGKYPSFINDSTCFVAVYTQGSATLYYSNCTLSEQ